MADIFLDMAADSLVPFFLGHTVLHESKSLFAENK